ncbi:uncharacterized protein MONBRDRAFT_26664 [Monosiga brevicollis MX1]|uniref:ABC transporter domain-containing protein n=1 Tax=Monosiga brevicollis TaxID=81824 RepID=A9V309_MONBE|nr:uncharacterized protein MONBRDRAFT_26664 [Monosiga brevicollis MX1]EDQ87980.1 predicted protein [Monosiga brevicollis MX1]|eukprot:XP_001747056.1 hypothetical protein [Monosiga brevicollis MX1]
MAASSWSAQALALTKKNLLLLKRRKRQTLAQLLIPLYMAGVTCLINLAVTTSKHPAVNDFTPMPMLQELNVAPNLTLAYFPLSAAQLTDKVQQHPYLTDLQLTTQGFASSDAFESWYRQNSDGLFAALDLNQALDAQHIEIYMKTGRGMAHVPSASRTWDSPASCHNLSPDMEACGSDGYLDTGLLQLEAALFEVLHNITAPDLANMTIAKMPILEFVDNSKAQVYAPITVIFCIMATSPLIQYLMINVVAEKELGIRNALLIMGMRKSAYLVSWLASYFLQNAVSIALQTTILCLGNVFSASAWIPVFLLLFCFANCLATLGLVFAPFFTDKRVAGAAGSLGNTIFSLIIFGVKNVTVPGTKWAISVLPPCAISLGLTTALNEDQLHGLSVSTMSRGEFSVGSAIIMLILDTVFYFALAYYLNEIVPGNGQRKPWNFMCAPATPSDFLITYCSTDYFDAGEDVEARLDGAREDEAVYSSLSPGLVIKNLGKKFRSADRQDNLMQHHHWPRDPKQVFGESSMEHTAAVGVCPQKDILFDVLTVSEHVELFAAIKGGFHGEDSAASSTFASPEAMLNEIDLLDKADAPVTTLSGGQKRKLCVGLALVGNPRLLALDEPSSGMDPASRRQLWSVLQKYRHGRVTLLTTHYMQEADVLGDRKVVLSRGHVQCVGSSLFLKKNFGVGYHIDVTGCQATRINSEVLGQAFPALRVELARNARSGTITVPNAQLRALPEILEQLEANASTYGLTSFGLRMTTLEEVFLELEKRENNEVATESEKLSPRLAKPSASLNNGQAGNIQREDLTLPLLNEQSAAGFSESFPSAFRGMLKLRLLQSAREWRALIFQAGLPILLMIIALTVVEKPQSSTDQLLQGSSYNYTLDSLADADHPLSTTLPQGGNAHFLTAAALNSCGSQNSFTTRSTSSDFIWTGPNSSFFETFNASLIGVNSEANQTTLYYNASAVHMLPTVMQLLYNSRASSQTTKSPSYCTSLRGLPTNEAYTWDASVYYTVLLIGIALSAIPGGFAVPVAQDKHSRMRHLLFVSGVTKLQYWGAFLLVDCAIFMVPVLAAVILALAKNVTAIIGPALPAFILAALLYIPVSILFSFNMSRLFPDPETTQSMWPVMNNFLGFIPYVIVGVVDGSSSANVARIIHYCFSALDPAYTFSGTLYYMFRLKTANDAQLDASSLQAVDYFKIENVVLPTILITLGHLALQAALLWWQERIISGDNAAITDEERKLFLKAEDVQMEHDITLSSTDRSLRVCDVYKRYGTSSGSFKAVNGVSFSVEAGEVFGLLGPNGAGKTTTIAMCSAEEALTAGDIAIGNHMVSLDPKAAFKDMGLCPQFSALWKNITVGEHLEFFASVHGLPRNAPRDWLESMGIAEYEHYQAKTLSGGTQRKVSLALALIGEPKVALLDEVSTGLDPGIMVFGELKTVGTTQALNLNLSSDFALTLQHLITRFGDGYMIDIQARSEEAVETVLAVLREKHDTELKLKYGSFVQLLIRLKSSELPDFLRIFNTLVKEGTVAHYGVSQPSLEQAPGRLEASFGLRGRKVPPVPDTCPLCSNKTPQPRLTREHLLTCRPIKRHNALRDEMGRLLRYATLSHVWVEKSGYNANGQSCRIDLHCRNPFPGGALGPALPDLGIDVTVRTAQPPTTSQACIKVGAALRRAEKEKREYYTGFNHGKTLIVPAAMTTTGGFASSFVDLLGQLARCAEARGVYQPGLDEAFVPRWKGRFAALVHQMNADHIQRHFGGVCLRSS